MSISPQSLASTREKRSSRIPARFDDCEIPPEVTCRSVAEALKVKTKAHKRINPDFAEYAVKRKDGSSTAKKAKAPKVKSASAGSSAEKQLKDQTSPTSSSTSASTPTQTPTPPIAATTPPPSSSSSTTQLHQEPVKSRQSGRYFSAFMGHPTLLTTVVPTRKQSPQLAEEEAQQSKSNLDEIELECKESPPNETVYLKIDVDPIFIPPEEREDNSAQTGSKAQGATTSKEEFVKKVYYEDSNEDTLENLGLEVQPTSKSSVAPSSFKKIDDSNVIKKSPFHPSIMISNGIRLCTPRQLIEKKLVHPSTLGSDSVTSVPTTNQTNVPKQASRKKSKGYSLMVKAPSNSGSAQGGNNLIRTPTTPTNQAPQTNQQTKFYNTNLAQNMQYGTRLMLNEPVYLPRSVATIAPITTTLQQIANQSRRPPFVSKRTEAYLTYQEERKFNYLSSNYSALLKIVEYLSVPELLNFKSVSKTCQSIIDSDVVWKQVRIDSNTRIKDWDKFAWTLCRHQTKGLFMNNYLPDKMDIKGPLQVYLSLTSFEQMKLDTICLRSEDADSSRFVLELLCIWNNLASCNRGIKITWKVKIQVEDDGRALVSFKCRTPEELQGNTFLYSYEVFNEMLSDTDSFTLVELSDLEDLFNGAKNDKSSSSPDNRPQIIIEPV